MGTINVANALGLTNLVLDDSEDPAGQTALLFNDGVNGQVTGLAPATINYSDGDGGVASLTVYGGSGGNTFTIDGTLDNPGYIPAPTDLFTGTGDNTVNVWATYVNGPLNIHGEGGQDAVYVGYFGSLTDILGPVFVDNIFSPPGFTDLTVDASADDVSHDFTLSSTAPDSILIGLAPADITYVTAALSSLTINTSDFGYQVMNIDMSGGNPIPVADTPGLTWNASPDGTGGLDTHALNIFGELPTGPFASETHNANDQTVFPQVGQYGSIFFDDGQGSALEPHQPLLHRPLSRSPTRPRRVNYTFNDFGYPDQSFSATDRPIRWLPTIEFASTPTPARAAQLRDDRHRQQGQRHVQHAALDPRRPRQRRQRHGQHPDASAGLSTLTFNTPTGGTNNVSFVNTPPGVVTSYYDGAGPAVTNVTGLGVAGRHRALVL